MFVIGVGRTNVSSKKQDGVTWERPVKKAFVKELTHTLARLSYTDSLLHTCKLSHPSLLSSSSFFLLSSASPYPTTS